MANNFLCEAHIQKAKEMVEELAAAGALAHTKSFYDFLKWVNEVGDIFSFDFTVSSGCFKIVIVPDDYDFVIKTAMTGSYNFPDEDASIEEQHKNLDGPYAEYEKWFQIKGTDFEQYFLELQYLSTVGTHEFYIQEKADIDEYAITDSLRRYVDPANFEDDESMDDYVEWDYTSEELFASVWGEDAGYDLMDFCYEMDITDTHKGNIGFVNCNPVIIDYAS